MRAFTRLCINVVVPTAANCLSSTFAQITDSSAKSSSNSCPGALKFAVLRAPKNCYIGCFISSIDSAQSFARTISRTVVGLPALSCFVFKKPLCDITASDFRQQKIQFQPTVARQIESAIAEGKNQQKTAAFFSNETDGHPFVFGFIYALVANKLTKDEYVRLPRRSAVCKHKPMTGSCTFTAVCMQALTSAGSPLQTENQIVLHKLRIDAFTHERTKVSCQSSLSSK